MNDVEHSERERFHTSKVTWSISRSAYRNEAVNCELHAEESGRDVLEGMRKTSEIYLE
jgi:hypothetical protein